MEGEKGGVKKKKIVTEKQRESKWTGMVHDTGYGSFPIAEMGKNLPSSSVLPD